MLISDFNKTKSPFGVSQKGTENKRSVSLMTTVCNNHKNLITMAFSIFHNSLPMIKQQFMLLGLLLKKPFLNFGRIIHLLAKYDRELNVNLIKIITQK